MYEAILIENPDFCIELVSLYMNTETIGLTRKRSNEVFKEMVRRGIDRTRLSCSVRLKNYNIGRGPEVVVTLSDFLIPKDK